MASDDTSAVEAVVIEHRHLRSALEFAVAIAAETAKRKPPMESPKELKRYYTVDRIPSAALGRVRRAVEADERFRRRIAAGAVPELVDEIGRLWLARPDGWQEQIVTAIADAEQAEDAEDAQRALKRAERRRRAAEQAATRAVADLVRLEAAVETANRERDELRTHLEVAEDLAAELRDELVRARTEARHAGDREQAAVRRLDEARRQLADLSGSDDSRRGAPGASHGRADARATAAAGRPAAAGHSGAVGADGIDGAEGVDGADGAVGVDGVGEAADAQLGAAAREQLNALRADVERAAAAVEGVAAQLRRTITGPGGPRDESGDREPQLEGATARPAAGGRRGRVPIPLPGGLRATSAAAAEHLLRSGVPVLVDGYNVAMLAWPARDLCVQREALIDAVENLARRYGATTTIVFDGSTVVGGHAPRRRLTRVVYSPEGVTADDVIRDEVARLGTSPVVVVTNDAEIVRDVKAVGANVVSSTTLLELL